MLFRSEPAGETRGLPFQWNLLAWAALVGILTGVAVVIFHELLGFINSFLYGPLVDLLLVVGKSAPLPPPQTSVQDLPAAVAGPGQPLSALLQLGLGGIGFLPPPPAPPEPPTIALPSPPDWLKLWPVLVIPSLGGQIGRAHV